MAGVSVDLLGFVKDDAAHLADRITAHHQATTRATAPATVGVAAGELEPRGPN